MRKSSCLAFALLIVALAGAASAQTHSPRWNQTYRCNYDPGPWSNELDPGLTTFVNQNGIYGIELFQRAPSGVWDNRKIAFVFKADLCPIQDPDCLYSAPNRSVWEFTIKDGVQCKNTVVRNDGRNIFFGNCTNGKTRSCELLY
jgi:hypothetical protein